MKGNMQDIMKDTTPRGIRAIGRRGAARAAVPWLLAPALAWSGAAAATAERTGSLVDHLDAIIQAMPAEPGGGQYRPPDAAQRELMGAVVAMLLGGRHAEADAAARTADYEVVLWRDDTGPAPARHAILQRASGAGTNWWGTYAVNLAPARPRLAIQCPHPRFDTNTGFQGARIYAAAGARALFLAGTHRCNGTQASPCDGLAAVCGPELAPYPHSDVAHAVDAVFQAATEALLAVEPEAVVVQAHGFRRRAGDPDLIISNGTWFAPWGPDHAARLAEALVGADPALTAVVAHLEPGWTRLIGSTNTQGRLLNGSQRPCDEPAIMASGLFIHVEQGHDRLRDTPQNWAKLGAALMTIVPAVSPPGAGARP